MPRNAFFAPEGYADEACARKLPLNGGGIVDPVKNRTVREATTGDYLAFLPAYFSIGLRNPGAYTASVLNVCGPLITPLETFSYFSTPEQKDTWIAGFVNADTKHELHLSFYKPNALEAVSDEVQAAFNDVADWHSPLLFFLTMGFYGGWMPLICLVLCLFYDRRGAVMLLPMLLCFGILVIGPASSSRYVLPLLYAAPLMMGVLCRAYGWVRVGAGGAVDANAEADRVDGASGSDGTNASARAIETTGVDIAGAPWG